MISTKPRKCKHCKARLDRLGMVLHDACVDPWLAANKEKIAAKAEAAKARVHRERLKASRESIPALIKLAQKEFNAYIRSRDKDQPCICCGKPLGADTPGGAFDCGHYRSVGSAPQLRFDERNAHAQRKHCNRWGAGRAVDYRLGLIARIGLDAVESLESNNAVHKWTGDELKAIRATYKAKRLEIERDADALSSANT